MIHFTYKENNPKPQMEAERGKEKGNTRNKMGMLINLIKHPLCKTTKAFT
jgi:hypothetical protein